MWKSITCQHLWHRSVLNIISVPQAGNSDANSVSSQVKGNGSSGGSGRPSQIPDLKTVIPYVKQKVLKDVIIVFTGCLPTNQRPEVAKIYQVAVSLGARVHKDISKEVTHLVAARPGTAKMAHARKFRTIKVSSFVVFFFFGNIKLVAGLIEMFSC